MEKVVNLVSASFEGRLTEEQCAKFIDSLSTAPADTTVRINKSVENVELIIEELKASIGTEVISWILILSSVSSHIRI